jgi:hypothetical protein
VADDEQLGSRSSSGPAQSRFVRNFRAEDAGFAVVALGAVAGDCATAAEVTGAAVVVVAAVVGFGD